MNKKQKLLVLILSVVVVIVVGCGAMMDGITPAFISPKAIEYSGEQPMVFTPYTSLWDLDRVGRGLEYQHLKTQIEIARDLEDDNLLYNRLSKAMQAHRQSAVELKDSLFSPEGGAMSLLLAGSGFGLGGYLMRRPADKKKIEELEVKLNGGAKA